MNSEQKARLLELRDALQNPDQSPNQWFDKAVDAMLIMIDDAVNTPPPMKVFTMIDGKWMTWDGSKMAEEQ